MFILQKPNQEVEVTLPFQRDTAEADRIKWRVRALSASDAMDYDREFARVLGLDSVEKNTAINSLIRRVALGWSNIVDADGKPLEFSDDALDLFSCELKLKIAASLPETAGWGDASKKGSASLLP